MRFFDAFPQATYKHVSNTPNVEEYLHRRAVYAGCMALVRHDVLSETVWLRDRLRNLLGRLAKSRRRISVGRERPLGCQVIGLDAAGGWRAGCVLAREGRN